MKVFANVLCNRSMPCMYCVLVLFGAWFGVFKATFLVNRERGLI